jgi:SnoaL-like domain
MTLDLEALAARLQRVEDELEIRRVILSYGPAADSGAAARAGALWTHDGEYDWDPDRPALVGPDGVARMLLGDGHQSLIAEGVAHFAGPPLVELDGDRATALSYSFVLRREAETQRIYVWRLGAARWEFARVDGAWRIHRRTHRQLDETGTGRELFGDTLRDGFGQEVSR